jgi:L-amino acid N-acyltransferase YncA
LAEEALTLFMAYACTRLGITKFRAKVGETNEPSIRLMKKLGYREVSRSSIFKEITLELPVEGDTKQELETLAAALQTTQYDL